MSNFRRLIVSIYFILTTLSTVGYGDYYPKSDIEKVVAIFLMIMGIALFSYIMNNFITVLVNYDNFMGNVDKSSELKVWLTSLSKFSSKPLPKELVDEVHNHF